MVNDWYEFPYEIHPVDSETNKKILNDFKGGRIGYVQVGNKKYFFPQQFSKHAEKYYNLEVRPDDVWVVSFPRSGTTLTQELVWLIENNMDYSKAAKEPLEIRFPFLEFGVFFNDELKQEIMDANSDSELNQNMVKELTKHGWETLPFMKSPRFIKTHLPFSLFPKDWHLKECKTIYVARNPKDVAISYYHNNRQFKTQGFQGDFTKYWGYFQQNLQNWAPYWSHIEEALAMKNKPNVLFLFYEDIVSDMNNSIKKIASFLGKTLNDKQINALENHLSFENFKNNTSVNAKILGDLKITKSSEQGFIRKGKSNNNDECTPELSQRIEEWIQDNSKKLNITFPKMY